MTTYMKELFLDIVNMSVTASYVIYTINKIDIKKSTKNIFLFFMVSSTVSINHSIFITIYSKYA